MPNLYSMIPSPTILGRQEDPLADPSPKVSVFVSEVPVVVVDNTPLPPIAMIAIKIYAYGGLAFLCGVVLTSISYWIWVVVIKGEYADSPPELDIHPERMREKEKARIARLKQQKEEKDAKRRRREEEKWGVRPLQSDRRKQNRSTTAHDTSPRPKSALKNSSPTTRSTSPAKKKHVTWAASTSTLDGDGNLRSEPLEDFEEDTGLRRSLIPLTPLHEVALLKLGGPWEIKRHSAVEPRYSFH